MSMITGTLAPLLKIKFKPRCDDYSDQFNRILMVKVSLISCIILGISWLSGTMSCIMPEQSGIDGGFVTQTCWIQGLYVYKNIEKMDNKELRYYGIPKLLQYDGTRGSAFCRMDSEVDDGCVPLQKTFYKQHQYFPFYMGFIALLYYLPYIMFRFVNTDLISLRTVVKGDDPDVHAIIRNYMNYQVNSKMRQNLRLIGNVVCKLLYVLVNVIALITTNSILGGTFLNLGLEMASWNNMDNSIQLDYTNTRSTFRAGDRMLPAYGICEVLELAQDIKHSLYNRHKFVCEISQNVLYQYTLMLLWFCLMIGLLVSVLGFLRSIVEHFCPLSFSSHTEDTKAVAQEVDLTLREVQYLEYVRKKKLTTYKELLKNLREARGGR